MNRIEYIQTGGFPLDSNNLNFLQESLKIMQAFGYLAGRFVIVSGCEQTGSTVGNGIMFIDGEVLEFRGGNLSENVIVREETVSAVFEDGKLKPIEIIRYATFGASIKNYPWASFKRGFPTTQIPELKKDLDTKLKAQSEQLIGLNKQMTEVRELTKGLSTQISTVTTQLGGINKRVTNLENRKSIIPIGMIAIWNKSELEVIPAGWKECTDLRGRLPLGWDPDDEEFKQMGHTAGEKTHALSIEEMPEHTHLQYWSIGSNGASGSGGSLVEGERETKPTGGSQPHNNMPPYRIIRFIEYVGNE